MDTIKVAHGKTRMVAHRGVSKLERENTYAAFVAAGNRSYWGVETDVRTTADGNFIILHDETTARVSGERASVKPEESTMETLRAISLTELDGVTVNPALRLPTLGEYIRVCKKYGKHCVLELKTEMDEATTARMIEVIRAEDYLEHVTFISFLFEDLVHVRKLLPMQKIQFLFGELSDELLERMKKYRMDVDIHYKHLTPELVEKFHDAGMEINCWTVDDPLDAERLIEWGVDYITSNILE
jgi:glycerophosphoryl diester phosphodiesterase